MGGGGDDKEKGGFFNPKNSDLVFGKGGLLNPKKVKKPKLVPAPVEDKDAKKKADAAGEKKKQMNIAAYGFGDTSGNLGLGKPSPQFLQYNTLLGAA